jgi:hypothetical protein
MWRLLLWRLPASRLDGMDKGSMGMSGNRDRVVDMRRTYWHIALLVAFAARAVLATSVASAADAAASNTDNGIVVGQPKIYDERSLEAMLASLKAGLGGANVINPAAAAANLGQIQGGQASVSSQSTSLSVGQPKPTPTPSSTPAPPAGQNSTPSTKSPDDSAGPPTFSAGGLALSAPLAISSEDMLQQQVGLSFQTTNLELLLEHALSDRLIFENNGATARALAVVGFQISIEPRGEDKNAVAEAEITLTSPDPTGDAPQVALMLPQDKTYNVAKVTSDSRTIALGGFAAPLLGSFNNSSSHDSAYVVYDVDTVALQRPSPAGAHAITFAWQFRPVLGQSAITPGTRQVYVLLSLPVDSQSDYAPHVSVHTYWKRLDTKAATVADEEMPDRSASYDLGSLMIHKMTDYDDGLGPKVDSVQTFDAGGGLLYVQATGSNFTPDTRVIIAGHSYPVAEKGGRMLSFAAPLSSMSYSNPILVGAYGPPAEVVVSKPLGPDKKPIDPDSAGLQIKSVRMTPADASDSILHIELVSAGSLSGKVQPPTLPSNGQLVITVGDRVYGLNDNTVIQEAGSAADTSIKFDVRVPNVTLRTAQKVTVRYGFCGDEYRDDYVLPPPPFVVDSVTLISHDNDTCVLAIKGCFSQDLQAYVYNGISEVVFSPTMPIKGSFLVLHAPSPPTEGAGHHRGGERGGGPLPVRGEQPVVVKGPTPEPTYTVAVLTAQRKDILSSDAIVLYQPDAPAQVVSISDCLSALRGSPAGSKQPAAARAPGAPEVWQVSGSFGAGAAYPAAGASQPGSSGIGGTHPTAIILQFGASKAATGGTPSAAPSARAQSKKKGSAKKKPS